MSQPPYRALQVALRIFSVLFAVGGLFMIFGSRGLIVRVFLHPPEAEVSTLLLFLLKEMGGMVLTLSVMLFLAARDPERNAAVIDGMTVGLCILAITPLISLYTLDVRRLYPAYLIWLRSLVRLVLAGVLYYLRPRETQWKPAGDF
jgi:Na+-driven multidrug efflux pump